MMGLDESSNVVYDSPPGLKNNPEGLFFVYIRRLSYPRNALNYLTNSITSSKLRRTFWRFAAGSSGFLYPSASIATL